MKKYYIIIIMLFACHNLLLAQDQVDVVTIDWYKNLRNINNDTTYIINFWATWCVPCVEELPIFEKINKLHTTKKVSVILVSLDAIKRKETILEPFIEKKKLQSKVVLLNEPNYNSWIDKVEPKWQGTLPATIVFNNKNRSYTFFENSITFEQLEKLILKNK